MTQHDYLQQVFDPSTPYQKLLYPAEYQQFLEERFIKPNICPKCHGQLYPEDRHGRLFEYPEDIADLTAISCFSCGWRFEVNGRVNAMLVLERLGEELMLAQPVIAVPEPTRKKDGWVCCRVQGCTEMVNAQSNMRYQLCKKHSQRYRDWKRNEKRWSPPFKAAEGDNFLLVELPRARGGVPLNG